MAPIFPPSRPHRRPHHRRYRRVYSRPRTLGMMPRTPLKHLVMMATVRLPK